MAKKPTYKELESEIKKLKKTISKNKSNIREIQDLAMIGNWVWDLKKQALIWSDEVYRIFGLKPGALKPTAEAFEATIHPDDREDFLKQRETMLNKKQKACIDHRIILPDGSIRYVQERAQLILNNQKKISRVIGTVQDITERKQAEEALKKSEKWHRNFLENLSDVVFEADNSGNITYTNKIAEILIGVPLKEIVGKPFLPFFDKKSQKVAADVYLRTLNGESTEYELTFKNGKIAHFKNKPLKDKDGKIVGVFGVARDITKLKMAEELLKKSNERLEVKVKNRTHELQELNTSLRVLLDQRKNDKERMEKTIMSNIKKLIKPSLVRLRRSSLNSRQKSELSILEANLNEIISPFESSLSSEYLKLTPTEMQVANFIKNNATSKEIASALGLSRRTIDTHRHNIRKKIGIRRKGVNLRTYLSSLT